MSCAQGFVIVFSCKGKGICRSCNGQHVARDRCPPRRLRHPAGVRAAVDDLRAEAIAGLPRRPPCHRRRPQQDFFQRSSGRCALRQVAPATPPAQHPPACGRMRKSTRPVANGVIQLSPFELLTPACRSRPATAAASAQHHGVFAGNHHPRRAGTALFIGNVGKQREEATDGHARDHRGTGGRCDMNPNQEPRSLDTSRKSPGKAHGQGWGKLLLKCPKCSGDIRLIVLITEPGSIRKILTHLGEPLEPPPLAPARGPPIDWGELVHAHDDRAIFQATDRRPAGDRHSPSLTCRPRAINKAASLPGSDRVRADAGKSPPHGGKAGVPRPAVSGLKTRHAAHEPLISAATVVNVRAEVPLAGQSFALQVHIAGPTAITAT